MVLRALGLAVLLLGPAVAQAQTTAEEDLAAVREQVLHATYRSAAPAVDAFLARTDLDAAQRNAGLELSAIIRLAVRDEAGAARALAELYGRDPGHRLHDPDASPVVQSAFARAREGAAPIPVTLESATEARLARRGAPSVSVQITAGEDAVHELRISYRHAGGGRWSTLVARPEGGAASVTLPLTTDAEEETLEFYVEALAPSSTVIGTLASAAEPRSVTVPRAEIVAAAGADDDEPVTSTTSGGGNIAEEAWLWVLVGVVVVGGGVGVGVGIALSQPGPTDGTLGNVTLPLVAF
jgi:hypothetical protein